MKTQIKRFSKSALAVVLTLCMLVSCMTVGIIATDAAKTADESLGSTSSFPVYVYKNNHNYDTWYMHNWKEGGTSTEWPGTPMTNISGSYYRATYDTSRNKVIFNNGNGGKFDAANISYDGTPKVFNDSGNTGSWVNMTYYLRGTIKGTNEWNAMTHPLTYDDSDGKWKITVDLNLGDKFQVSSCFNGALDWNIQYGGSNGNDYEITSGTGGAGTYEISISDGAVNRSVLTVTKKTTVTKYTVTYGKSGTGTITASNSITSGSSVDSGTSVTFTATPGDGQVIEGWYSDSNCTNSLNNGTSSTYQTTITSNTTVYVKFVGTYSIYIKDEASWGDVYLYPYENTVWSWPGKQVFPTSSTASELNVTTTAETGVYKVTGIPKSATKIILSNNASNQTGNNVALKDNALYITKGSGNDRATDIITEDYTPEATYAVTVTAGSGGKISVNSATASSSQTATVGATTTATVTATANTGYHFTGWTKTGDVTFASGSASTATVTINASSTGTLTAAFAKTNYTVTLNNNSGTGGTTSVTATYGDAMPSATMPTRAGYTFEGYYDTDATTGGTQYYTAAGASARTWNKTSATTLYARWTEVTGGAVAKAYTSGDASSTGGTVKVGTSGTPSASVDLSTIGITTSNTVIAANKTNYSFTGWQFSGTKAANLRYRFGTSGDWLTPAAGTTYGTASDTTIYIKTDGSSGITNTNAEVRALFVPTDYTGLTVGAQYTLDNSTYTDFATTPSGVTIAANHGTNQTGVAVTASATDPTGYVFAGWYTANGSFENSANKDTTFKPNAANAKAIARYKKIFTITSSVDSTGTGAGTVTTSKTSVEAGGSYTITATAKSGSAIESVKVNDTAKTATASQTISSVSADQTVKVKFKSNITIRGNSTIGTNWDSGDAMNSNAAGTEFTKTYENVPGSSSGTSYEFKLHNGSSFSDDSSATITITGGESTGTMTKAAAGVNWKLTLKKNANITIKSDGTKITEIKVVPADSTKYAVTFKKADNTTITGQYEGTNFSTASADATVQVYEGDEISFTVTAAEGKYISSLTGATFTPAYSAAVSDYKITNVNEAKTITPSAASMLSVTAKSNKSDRGTVQVDAEDGKAYPGQIVKVTVTPKNGVLKSLTVKDASGTDVTLRDSIQTSSLNYSQLDVATVTALMYDFFNKSGEALGATANDEALGADTVKYFTMPNSSVTVSATLEPYSAESNWYYNGYDTSGNAVSGYHGKQMTEAMVGGEKFSYYEVTGRSDENQLMTVSNGAASSGTRYVYFTASAEGGWSTDENHQYAYFYNTSGAAGNAWPGYKMTKYTTNDYGQNVYRVEIPTVTAQQPPHPPKRKPSAKHRGLDYVKTLFFC